MGGAFSCVPNATSLSRSLIQEQTGGRTQIASVVSSFLILIILLWIAPFFELLPRVRTEKSNLNEKKTFLEETQKHSYHFFQIFIFDKTKEKTKFVFAVCLIGHYYGRFERNVYTSGRAEALP